MGVFARSRPVCPAGASGVRRGAALPDARRRTVGHGGHAANPGSSKEGTDPPSTPSHPAAHLLPSQPDLLPSLPGLGAPTILACLLSLKHTPFFRAFALLLTWTSVSLGLGMASDFSSSCLSVTSLQTITLCPPLFFHRTPYPSQHLGVCDD